MFKIVLLLGLLVSLYLGHFNYQSIDLNESHDYLIEIKGEVERPGIYHTDGTKTTHDLLDMAGIKEESDLAMINLSLIPSPNSIISIPKKMDKQKISINSASLAELCTLKGIKETLAQRIIDYRNDHGGFKTLEELLEVKGIGEKKYEALLDDICL